MSNYKVSVIVPIYNVEKYLRECLDSLANQTLEELEVIMIDDGSLDGSPAIVDEYAANYPNFFGYHIENGGLGHARNYGFEMSHGKYVAFLDSDDFVDLKTYELAYDLAEENNSDFVTFNAKHINSVRTFASRIHKTAIKDNIALTNIHQTPSLMFDTSAWNKVIRADFYRANKLFFPEKMLYEDLPFAIDIYLKAERVSVIGRHLYFWRVRDGGAKSITQTKDQMINFLDREKSIDMVYKTLSEYQGQDITALKVILDEKVLSHDMRMYFQLFPTIDETYKAEIANYAVKIYDQAEPQAIENLKARDKIKYYLSQKSDLEQLTQFIDFEQNEMAKKKNIWRDGKYYGDYPFQDVLPKDLFEVGHELTIKDRIEKAKISDDEISIEGYCYIVNLDADKKDQVSMNFWLTDGNQKISLSDVKLIKRTDITMNQGREVDGAAFNRLYNYDYSGYQLSIPMSLLRGMEEADWTIMCQISNQGLTKETILGNPTSGNNNKLAALVDENRSYQLRYNYSWESYIRIAQVPAYINEVSYSKEKAEITLKGFVTADLKGKNLFAYLKDNQLNEKYPIPATENDGAITVLVPVSLLDDRENSLRLQLMIDDDIYAVMNLIGRNEWIQYIRGGQCFRFNKTTTGHLTISKEDYSPGSTITLASKKKFVVKVDLSPNFKQEHPSLKLALVNDDEKRYILGSLDSTDTLEVEFSAFSTIPYGNYLFCIVTGDSKESSYYCLASLQNYYRFVGEHDKSNRKIFLTPTKKGLQHINIEYQIEKIARGPRRQEVLKKIFYPLMRKLPLKKKTVVFSSYWYSQFSCNPKAMYEEMSKNYPDYDLKYIVNDPNIEITGRGERILEGTVKYYYNLARAKYFVNNVNFPDFIEKRSGAVEVQTMHGTPLKTLGLDVPGEVDTVDKRDRFLRRCSRWDMMTTPNTFVTNLVPKIFLFDRKIVQHGYPRNDYLVNNKDNEALKAEIRAKLNLPEGKKFVLYAPTFRVMNGFKLELDLDKMSEVLGDEYVTLVRLHYFVAKKAVIPDSANAVNVSDYPSIQDLFLISDILVTDYSSSMFDFGVLGKEMYFYTYDLDEYQNDLRGTYFNITDIAPGPVVRTTEELADAIKADAANTPEYTEKYQTFFDTFCKWDKGDAAKIAVEEMLKIKN